MYAMIGVLKKPEGMDSATFREWWLNDHVAQAKKLPGLRRYVVHPLKHGFDMQTGAFTNDPSHQGLAFLWFDDEAACRAAFASATGREDREHMEKSPIDALVFCTEETIEIPL